MPNLPLARAARATAAKALPVALGVLLLALLAAAAAPGASAERRHLSTGHPHAFARPGSRPAFLHHRRHARHARRARQPSSGTATAAPSTAPDPSAPAPKRPAGAARPPAPSSPAEAAPAPSPSPGSGAGLLFRGARIRDFRLNQSAPGAVAEVPDPAGGSSQVLKMTVADTDVYPITPTADPRAQLLSPSIIDPGEEFWWSARFFLPSDFPSSVPGWLTVIEGPYGEPFDGTPPWHIEVNGSNLRWSRNSTYGWDVPWQVPLVRDRWVSVLVHERFAEDGWVEMWVDGQQVTFFAGGTYNPRHEAPTARLAMATRDRSNDGGPNFTVIQSYRKAGMFSSVSLFQGPMAIGATRASVE
jgi:Polysaccharide lyase